MEQIEIQHLTFTYPGADTPALNDVSLSLAPGSFSVLCGRSGSGKSTLLRQLKPALAPNGKRAGMILYNGTPLSALDGETAAKEIGFLLQNPDRQMVTDKVWHELAFGLENLGLSQQEIHLRVGETAAYFGMESWFYRETSQLSGGQKQLLALASAMALRPKILLLDEPTAQLDPIHTENFWAALKKINQNLGVTILLSEHRLEQVLPLCDRLVVMEKGKISFSDWPQKTVKTLIETGHPMSLAAPDAARICAGLTMGNSLPSEAQEPLYSDGKLPLSIKEGRTFLSDYTAAHPPKEGVPAAQPAASAPVVLSAKNLWFRYEKEGRDILHGLSLSVEKGSLFAVMGGTGSGKSTLLSLLSGNQKPLSGKISAQGRVLCLPQDPACLFLKDTVEKDLLSVTADRKQVKETAGLCGISHLLSRHPFDLSGGEQQRAALAKLLLCQPDILLLDEPTKGMDAFFKTELAGIFAQLRTCGMTILMVSHDVNFCAEHASGCAFLFGGELTAFADTQSFFAGNNYYTTDARRISSGILPRCITAKEVLACFQKEIPGPLHSNSLENSASHNGETLSPAEKAGSEKTATWQDITQNSASTNGETLPPAEKTRTKKTSTWQDATQNSASTNGEALSPVEKAGSEKTPTWQDPTQNSVPTNGETLPPAEKARTKKTATWQDATQNSASTNGETLPPAEKAGNIEPPPQQDADDPPSPERKHSKNFYTLLSCLFLLVSVPLILWTGIRYFDDRRYYFISLCILGCALAASAIDFEGRRPRARELVLIAVMTGTAVLSRSALYMVPQFKPMTAMVIIAGISMGSRYGFATGALAAFISNFFFGQGPWTPWQMFAYGIIGFTAGLLPETLKKCGSKAAVLLLSLFGFLATLIFYGGIMNPASILMTQADASFGVLLASYLPGLPFDLMHGVSTAVFLLLLAKPIRKKVERIQQKYGLLLH